MIQIDMPMPKSCAACIFLKVPATTDCFQCIPDGRYMYDDDKVWMTEKRPNWCPMKEQEAVKPYIDIDEAKCPICKVKLTRQELLGDDVLFEDFYDYCPHCGRKVKWE